MDEAQHVCEALEKAINNPEEMTKVNKCVTKNVIEVTGDDVKMYSLFCEHTTEHQCVWKGERGSTTFFQCELPYYVDINFVHNQFTGYYVDVAVENHTARGFGVYFKFQCFDAKVRMGIRLPSKKGIILQNPFTHFLNNKGSIQNVLQQGRGLFSDKVHNEHKYSNARLGEDRGVAFRVSNCEI